MSFFVENNTDINMNYVSKMLKNNALHYEAFPDLHIRLCRKEKALNLPRPNCSINGYCFYDSKKSDNKFVFSKDNIYLILDNDCSKAVVYCPNEMPSYKQHEILRLISIAFMCTVIKSGGIYIRGLVFSHDNDCYFACSEENDIIARKCAQDLQKPFEFADYCVLKINEKYSVYPLPWNKKDNNYQQCAYDFDSMIFINNKEEPFSSSQLSPQKAKTLLTKNNYVRNISKELYEMYIQNVNRIFEHI